MRGEAGLNIGLDGTRSAGPEAVRAHLTARSDGAVPRPEVRGKFIFVGDRKLYVRGATYGTFRPNGSGDHYPERRVVERDFARMAANGLNAVRTYTLPPRWLLDVAAHNGLFVMVGLAWEQHVDFLEERQRARSIEERVRAGVAACAGHPAVLCYAVGNEIPSPVVRWLGPRRVERYLKRLHRAAKEEDPGALVTYVNYPSTEYLRLPFPDFLCFNVYLETLPSLEGYLARLHNIAGDRPLVMAEIGLDSRTHGKQKQASFVHDQIRATLEGGCAGAFVFSWTDQWYVSYLSDMGVPGAGVEIDDWDFGLTDRDRRAKPALIAASEAFEKPLLTPEREWPRISVVVCTFNGEATLPACLEDLRRLAYPNFEVIVVNDGSTDRTAAVVEQYGFRLISTVNRGLASARNAGMKEASGEIVAYLDDDARPDSEWLTHLALTFQKGADAGVGGPNIPPCDDGLFARCVAEAPGGPAHVLLSDTEAEHIPGCNMAFRKRCLESIGGFDPQFRVAGDDVDICWRLQEAGYKVGFSPAAMVWHQRRRSLPAYWKQQRDYGRAEALLERKWPEKYNAGGHPSWAGRLYGTSLSRLGRWRVYYGTWGSELFQSLYGPGASSLSSFALMPEWYLLIAALGVLSLGGVLWAPLLAALPLLALAACTSLVTAGLGAARPSIPNGPLPRLRRTARWVLTTSLYLTQPLARLYGRLDYGLTPWRLRTVGFTAPLPRTWKLWSERWQSGEERLRRIESAIRRAGPAVSRGGPYARWDLEMRGGAVGAARVRVGLEEHGGGRQLIRVRAWPRLSVLGLAAIVLFGALAAAAGLDGAWAAALTLACLAAVLLFRALQECGAAMGSVGGCLLPPKTEAEALQAVEEEAVRPGLRSSLEQAPTGRP